jgi:hypothetical protein
MKHEFMNRRMWVCWTAIFVFAVMVACEMSASEEPVRFPPLWQVKAVDIDESWQWEGTIQAGLDAALSEAGRCLEAQGWSYAYAVDINTRPITRLTVWRRGDSEFMLLLKEQSAARWAFSAGVKKVGKIDKKD